MLKLGDLAHGGHQAHWVEMFEAGRLRNPWYLRLAWRVKDLFCPSRPLEGYGRILPGQSIQKIGTGYHDPLMPGEKTRSVRRGGSCAYRYQD